MRLVLSQFFAVIVASCSAPSAPSVPTGPPPVTGSIVARDVRISIGNPPTIHVKESVTAECGVVFLVTPSTRILRRGTDGKVTAAPLSDLTVGQRVGVWAGVVLDSCPGQSSATHVEILNVR